MAEELLESLEIPWEQLPGESELQFSWFDCYKNLGPERSIARAYSMWYSTHGKVRPKSSGEWNRAAKTFLWEERASLWDREQRAEFKVRDEEEHQRIVTARLNILKLAYNKLTQALDKLVPEMATWSQVINGVDIITNSLRIEFNDLPSNKHIIENVSEGTLTRKVKTYRTVSPDDWDVSIAVQQQKALLEHTANDPAVITSTAEEISVDK